MVTGAQDLTSLGGKVLRVDPRTGAGALGNPFGASSPVYSYGFRNPQGLALRPDTDQMWLVEHGPKHDDEINLLAAGGNYGWDPIPGDGASVFYDYADEAGVPMTDLAKFPSARHARWSSGFPTLATSGAVFLDGPQWGEWEGRLAVATLKTKSLRVFEFTEAGEFAGQIVVPELDGTQGRLRTPVLGPDGALYIATSNRPGNDRILRVSANRAATGAPFISGTPRVGEELAADTTRIADADGLESAVFRYQWIRLDGAIETNIGTDTSSYTLVAEDLGQRIRVRVTFTDDAENEEYVISDATETVAPTAPGAPKSLKVSVRGTGTLEVSWQAPASDGGSAITGYKVQWKESADGWETPADVSETTVTGTTHTVTGLTDGVEYSVRVRAVNDVGEGPLSAEAPATPQEAAMWSATLTVGTAEDFAGYSSFAVGEENNTLGGLSSDTITVEGADRTVRVRVLGVLKGKLLLTLKPKLTAGFVLTVGNNRYSSGDATTREGRLSIFGYLWDPGALDWTEGDTITVGLTASETPSNTPATGGPTISGTAQVGETLTADTSGVTDADGLDDVSYNYQWIAGDANIQHATGSTHTLTDDDAGKAIKVKVSFTDDAGNAETLTSRATTAVAPPPNRPVAGAPSIQGVLQDRQVLSADTVGIADADGLADATISYQWMRVADGDAVDITGATGSTYTLTSTDVGDGIQLQVAFTDDRDNAESITSAVTEAVVASGAARELLWLSTMTPEDPGGLDTDYQFDSSADNGNLSPAAFTDGEDTRAITFLGASFGSNTTLALELGSEPTTMQVAAWKLVLHDAELPFTDAIITQTDSSPPSHRFQWDVTALAVDDRDLWDDGDAFTVSLLEAVNLSAAGVPTISGTPQVNETLTADTSGIADGNGLDNVSYAYQWTAGGSDIDGATGSSLTLTSSQEGQTIQVTVSFTDDDGFSETATSVATDTLAAAKQANSPAEGLPTIGGTPQVDQTLTADTSPVDDEDGLTSVSYRYRWIAGGSDIDGATGSTYTLTYSEQGQTIQVRVTFTDDRDNEETLTSAATVAVAAAPNRQATGQPTISGTPQVGQTLTADTSNISDLDGITNPTFFYQWRGGGLTIIGATGSTHTLTASDQGKTITVRVRFTDDRNSIESRASNATTAVGAAPNRQATGKPTIDGTPQVEQTLTADTSPIEDEDGLTNASYRYQWVAGGSDIDGATSSTYTLTASEQGQTIQVRVTFTDDRNNAETLTSIATAEVAAAPEPLTVRLKVAAPTSHDGSSEFTFEIEFSEEFGLSFRTLKRHAFNVTGGKVERAQRTDQPSNISWRITVKPTSTGDDVVIELPATTDCDAQGAICTGDGRKLSNSLNFTVSGPEP